jgi:hypothetical protein
VAGSCRVHAVKPFGQTERRDRQMSSGPNYGGKGLTARPRPMTRPFPSSALTVNSYRCVEPIGGHGPR